MTPSRRHPETKDQPPDTETIKVRHADPKATLSYGGQVFTPDKDGLIDIPLSARDLAASHDFFEATG